MTPCSGPRCAQSQPQTGCLVSVASSHQTLVLLLQVSTSTAGCQLCVGSSFHRTGAGTAAPRCSRDASSVYARSNTNRLLGLLYLCQAERYYSAVSVIQRE